MTHAQLIPASSTANDTAEKPRYEPLLGERIYLGRLLADQLSHLQEMTPHGRGLFQRLLDVDARLARFDRYDADLHRLVLPAEDARLHQPPDVPTDHHWSPCSLCRGNSDLGRNATVVLMAAGGAR